MKKVIVALGIMSASTAYGAQQLSFGDINYFLKEDQFNLAADVSSTFSKVSEKGEDTLETRGYLFETRYGYALTDELNFSLGIDYAYDREVENKTDPSDADYRQEGFANPSLAGNYRLLNQRDSLFNLDFGAVARINVEEEKIGSASGQSSYDGNFSNGRNSLELNTRIGTRWDLANEWQLAAGLIYHNSGEATLLQPGSNVDVDVDSSTDLFLRAIYQYRPVHEFMIALSAQLNQVGEVSGDVGNVRVVDDAHMDMDFAFRAKYLITDSFIANFHYGMSRNADFDRDTGGTVAEVKKRRENFYGLGVDFLF